MGVPAVVSPVLLPPWSPRLANSRQRSSKGGGRNMCAVAHGATAPQSWPSYREAAPAAPCQRGHGLLLNRGTRDLAKTSVLLEDSAGTQCCPPLLVCFPPWAFGALFAGTAHMLVGWFMCIAWTPEEKKRKK